MSLTFHQRRALVVIDRLTVFGVSPSYDQIAQALNLRSKSGTARIVDELISRGVLSKAFRRTRSLQITPEGRAFLTGSMDLSALSNTALKQLARDVQAEIRRRTPKEVAA